ncbi:hypothetical protein BT96DRAFT_1000937 [Gymnopus androsaceus JB14]|uniref:Uncharacterized protein n=1 Tax=Gymnopus androsaceus JB14 TaxID=1447944 RepID=A0A6A4H2A6_9AGAR|nr:hypothetical protein BT96DRAFT_1000937 [Gymnopus androsaceus JB14]
MISRAQRDSTLHCSDFPCKEPRSTLFMTPGLQPDPRPFAGSKLLRFVFSDMRFNNSHYYQFTTAPLLILGFSFLLSAVCAVPVPGAAMSTAKNVKDIVTKKPELLVAFIHPLTTENYTCNKTRKKAAKRKIQNEISTDERFKTLSLAWRDSDCQITHPTRTVHFSLTQDNPPASWLGHIELDHLDKPWVLVYG